MAGLMSGPAPQDAQDISPQEAAPQGGAPGGALKPQEASPQEQDIYNRFVGNAMHFMYNPNVLPKIVQNLKATPDDPIGALATTTVHVIDAVQQSATKGGMQIPDEVLYHGGVEIGEQLADVASKAKIHDYTQGELDGATYRAMDMWREHSIATGQTDPNDLKQQMGAVQQADQAGVLGKLIPGLDKKAPQQAPDQSQDQQEPQR